MSAAMVVLPMVWATSAVRMTGVQRHTAETARLEAIEQQRKRPAPGLAFYRKHTEGLLRRYVRLSMEAGKVPSLMGKEMFRGKVTHYTVQGFDDVVIFVQDVEMCLDQLDNEQRLLIERIALQEYTQIEAAGLMGLPVRSVHRWYLDALDVLTEIFLEKVILDPMKICQEA